MVNYYANYYPIRTDKTGTDKDDLVGKKPNPLRRLQLFYTSPAVKFILNSITYLIFLGEDRFIEKSIFGRGYEYY